MSSDIVPVEEAIKIPYTMAIDSVYDASHTFHLDEATEVSTSLQSRTASSLAYHSEYFLAES